MFPNNIFLNFPHFSRIFVNFFTGAFFIFRQDFLNFLLEDELGRITLPMELRKVFNIEERDSLEIYVEDDKIILKKYAPTDIFTGDREDLIEYHGKMVSRKTIEDLAKLADLI